MDTNIPPGHVDRDMLLAAIRAVAKEVGGNILSQRKFLIHSKMTVYAIQRHFTSWSQALAAAGCERRPVNGPIEAAVLFADWAGSVRKIGRPPTCNEHTRHGEYNPATITRRLGAWQLLPDQFRKFAGDTKEWADVLPLLPPPGCLAPTSMPGYRLPKRLPPHAGERVYGAPIDFKNIRHAPVNEMGVVHLFGAMSQDLGFLIESVQGAFPDCEAKQCSADGKWLLKRIEFEYESRNFRDHGHPPEGCDIIVCWNHNWPECPKHIEVIALSEEVARVGDR